MNIESVEFFYENKKIKISGVTSDHIFKIIKGSNFEELRERTPLERKDMIKFSLISSKIRFLKEPDGLDWFLTSQDFDQDDKDFVLFNINNLEEISNLRYLDFKSQSKRFKERSRNA